MGRTWHAVSITVHPAAAEAVESAFNELGSLGSSIDSLRKREGEAVIVIGYFEDAVDLSNVRAAIERVITIFGHQPDALQNIEADEIEDADWLAEWKRHWTPTEIGKFVVAPPWADVGDSDKHVIRIEPNMAFGTGTHETTQLCLQAIGDFYKPGMTFLDVGTGTGILAIAAAKLGGKDILACDTDADSVRIARENAELNGVAEQIDFHEDSIDEATPVHDLVCANLTIDVIVPMLRQLLDTAEKMLLLSGILVEQEEVIARELQRSQISNFKFRRSGEWMAVIIDRTAS